MRNRPTERLKSSQKTVRHFQEAQSTNRRLGQCYQYFESSQSHMLIEDIHTQIIPYEGISRKKSFSVELAPASGTVEGLVASALNGKYHHSQQQLTRAVADFIRECAQSVVCFGEVIYELVYLSNEDDPEKVVAFEFQPAQPLSVKRIGANYVQTIPPRVAKSRGLPQFINLPLESILIFQLPQSLNKSLKRTLDSLVMLSEKLMPEFAIKDLPGAVSKYRYDSAEQLYYRKLALGEAGKQIGWNARTLISEEMLEFYQLKRQLRFEGFKLQLRNSIVETLNKGLKIAGKKLDFEAQLNITGLPTRSDIDLAEADLDSGRRAFGDILKQFLYY